jgi:hypothetical protein
MSDPYPASLISPILSQYSYLAKSTNYEDKNFCKKIIC